MRVRLRDIKGFEDKDVVWSERSIGMNRDLIINTIRQYFTDRGEMPLDTITTITHKDIVKISDTIISKLPLLIEGMD